MNKVVFLIIAHLLCRATSPADTTLTVSFWNVENLFDLEDDPNKRDDEFTPTGQKHVTQEILDLKLNHLVEMLTDLNADILGLAEVENSAVLEMLDLRYQKRDYRIVHYESRDVRGIDVAMLYDPHRFTLVSSSPISVDLGGGRPTRDILHVLGKFRGVELHLFVNHWPSHWGGTEATNPLRALAAATLRNKIDAILKNDRDAEIVIMGDLNDQPTAPSVAQHLGSSVSLQDVRARRGMLWNLMGPFVDEVNGGSYKYGGKDLVYDQIIVSPGLADTLGLFALPESIHIPGDPKYRQRGEYEGYPFRFWTGNRLLGGYSDHLPVSVSIGAN